MLTDDQLAEWQRLSNAARLEEGIMTDKPLRAMMSDWHDRAIIWYCTSNNIAQCDMCARVFARSGVRHHILDLARLFAAAPVAIPALLAEVSELRKRVAELEGKP